MQALEKITNSNYWITLIFMLLLVFIVVLKTINADRLKENIFALFNVGFVENEANENASFFDFFQIITFIFSIIVFSLVVFNVKFDTNIQGFSDFIPIFFSLLFYFLAKRLLEYLTSIVFLIKNEVLFFKISKNIYLIGISFLMFIALILYEYLNFHQNILLFIGLFLFGLRFVFHCVNNKKLIFSQLFYFILYICAFEIAPLFLLFKLMF